VNDEGSVGAQARSIELLLAERVGLLEPCGNAPGAGLPGYDVDRPTIRITNEDQDHASRLVLLKVLVELEGAPAHEVDISDAQRGIRLKSSVRNAGPIKQGFA
jgi:hypothetical protein